MPTASEYNQAIQNLRLTAWDEELRGGEPALSPLGLPLEYSGNFAIVYQVQCPKTGKTWAVKCFTKEVDHRAERYDAISQHLQQARLPFMVEFQYQERGILVGDRWYPIVKMDWVEGAPLNRFVAEHLEKPGTLRELLRLWVMLAKLLDTAKVTHADLQHGNVLLVPPVREGEGPRLRLVDYDGMHVPALAARPSGELGHRAYQHPQRLREGIYSAEVDRFSHLAIYCAIQSLLVGGRDLWKRYDNEDNLLFRAEDFANPQQSRLLHELWSWKDPAVRVLVGRLLLATQQPLAAVPLLDELHRDGKLLGLSREEEERAAQVLNGSVKPEDVQGRNDRVATSTESRVVRPDPRRRREEFVEPLSLLFDWFLGNWRAIGVTAVCVSGFWLLILLLASGDAGQLERLRAEIAQFRDGANEELARRNATIEEQEGEAASLKSKLDALGKDKTSLDAKARKQTQELANLTRQLADARREGDALKDAAMAKLQPEAQRPSPQPEVTPASPSSGSATAATSLTNSSTSKFTVPKPWVAGVERSEPPEIPPTGGSLRSTPATPRSNLEVLNSIGMKLMLIPAGEFLMGSPESEQGANPDEKPQHRVRITKPFYLGVYEVTQAQYQKVVGSNPSEFKGESLPVETVSWEDAQEFRRTLSALPAEATAGRRYRLPTEAEWEYACRAGSSTQYPFGDSDSELASYAWYGANSGSKTHPVGQKQPNAWGLYDMQGNVWEWCADWHGAYEAGTASDPTGPASASGRVYRGGGWSNDARYCRSAGRRRIGPAYRNDSLGFRVAGVGSGF